MKQIAPYFEDPQNLQTVLVFITAFALWAYLRMRRERQLSQRLSEENTHLLAQTAILEAEQLKFQLQPHTLNNILANLKAVASKLHRGMDALSETLEYIIYKGKGHLVSVEDELVFIKRYLVLNELFMTHMDSIKLDDTLVNANSEFYRQPCLPHLVTGYLLENAFKHGDTRDPNFMTISVSLTDKVFTLSVTNKVRPGRMDKKGGVGLVNMRKRLDLLTSGNYELQHQQTDSEYISTLTVKLK